MLEFLIDMVLKKMKDQLAIERAEIELVQEDKLVEEEILNRNIKLRALIYKKNKQTKL